MNDFLQNIPQPDDVWKWAIEATLGPGLAVTVFLVYNFVVSWLGAIKSTRSAARWLAGTAQEARSRLREMPSGQRTLATVMSAVLLVVQLVWLAGLLVVGDMLTFAYQGSGRRFLELEAQNAASAVSWLDLTPFTKVYALVAAAILVAAVFSRKPNVNFLAFLIGIPAMPWGFSVAVLTVLEVVFAAFGWLGTGEFTLGGDVLWHLVFSLTIGLYLASCVVAVRAARRMGSVWGRRA
ncbi:hypothetical protein Psi02_38270 [Planotetraspora silvatica]|uniref:Uncharacterized protein n=1 Tax=Planotetraspora silvatica TaxID=234614 RepID=A0A8J3XSK5_9ACTN|nr:hypothetical protein [Planotetraspora silvatica]GII47403.1 hypothetical protein Psi02_38270 [Planotetraspora silvatica]